MKKIKRLFAAILSFLMCFCLCKNVAFAYENGSDDDCLGEIVSVENIGWEKESTLTLCWDKVEGADSYQIEAIVYYENWQGDDIFIDNIFTETSYLSIDLQQEIRTLVGEDFFDSVFSNGHYVKVQCKVSAYVNLDNGNNKMIAESSYSDKKVFFINYSYDDIELDAPKNLVLNPDTLELTFDIVDNATGYSIEILIPKSGNTWSGGTIIKEIGNGTVKVDVSDTLRRLCTKEYISLIRSGDGEYRNSPIEVCATVTAYYKNYATKRSEESRSNEVDYYVNLIELDKPQNLIIDQETMMLSFDCVEGATQYEVYVGNEEMGCYLSSDYDYNEIEEERIKINIESIVNSFTTSYGKTNESNEVFVEVEAFAYDEKAMCTAWSYGRSERSNKVSYYNKMIDLLTPQNVILDPDTLVISFNRVEGATYYTILIYNEPDGEGVGDRYYQKGQGTERIEYDIEDIVTMYKRSDKLGSNGVFARVQAVAFENDDINALQIGASEWAESNYVADSRTEVETIAVSPRNPICYVGKTRPLGKTINPVNAYYENIEWSSDNDNIVSIDEIGKITGKSVGTANITAKIGETSDTVLVTVYDIISNIEDNSENQEVTDTAGDIIDDIVNNDNPDLSNTDINPEDVDQIKEEIQEAIDNGDAFHTDIKYIQEYFEKYKKNWGQIQKAAGNLNAQFEGAYNIEVEMYHKDKDDVEHHIGNITELENEVTFTFNLPTGMKEQQSGETKKYVLVRIHKNKDGETEYTPVDYTINDDGTFTAKSSEYSDFVWIGIEESNSEDDCSILGHKWDDGKVTKEATETEEGIKTYTCSVCEETYTETIPKLDPVVIDPVKAFVTRFYTIILQRETINDEEIEYYTSRLLSHELDGCSVAKGFIMSPEYTGKGEDDSTFVNKMYATFFNREADDAAFYINLLESGYSREVVLAGFVNSPEFKTLCADYGINPGELIIDSQNNNHGNNEENNQGSNEDDITKLNLDTTNVDPDKLDAYVKNLYIKILGRNYDDAGLQYWKEQIMTGTTYDAATAARVGFFESEEYKAFGKDSKGFVTDCYHAFLGRDPEPAGLEYWMNKLDSGEYSKQKVIDLGFGHSEEFKGILTNCGFRIIE